MTKADIVKIQQLIDQNNELLGFLPATPNENDSVHLTYQQLQRIKSITDIYQQSLRQPNNNLTIEFVTNAKQILQQNLNTLKIAYEQQLSTETLAYADFFLSHPKASAKFNLDMNELIMFVNTFRDPRIKEPFSLQEKQHATKEEVDLETNLMQTQQIEQAKILSPKLKEAHKQYLKAHIIKKIMTVIKHIAAIPTAEREQCYSKADWENCMYLSEIIEPFITNVTDKLDNTLLNNFYNELHDLYKKYIAFKDKQIANEINKTLAIRNSGIKELQLSTSSTIGQSSLENGMGTPHTMKFNEAKVGKLKDHTPSSDEPTPTTTPTTPKTTKVNPRRNHESKF